MAFQLSVKPHWNVNSGAGRLDEVKAERDYEKMVLRGTGRFYVTISKE
jgi:hypothetical protein